MIYCREKLVDMVLDDPWIQLEDKFDFEIAVNYCINNGIFSTSEWQEAEEFLATGNNFNVKIEKIIKILANELGYTDEKFLNEKPELVKAVYYSLEKGVRL